MNPLSSVVTVSSTWTLPSSSVIFTSISAFTSSPWQPVRLWTLQGWVYVMNGATETKNSPSGRSYICSPPSSVTISDSESMEADSAILPALSSATYSLMLPASLSALLEHPARIASSPRSEEHTSELQSRGHLVCRRLLEKKNSLRCAGFG